MSREVDKEKMRRCLKEANMYDENMPNEMLVQVYKAVKDSETSMHEESMRQTFFDNEADKSLIDSANELSEAINNSESIAPSQKKAKTQSESCETTDEFELVQPLKMSRDQRMIGGESNNNIQVGKGKGSEKELKTKSKADIMKDIHKISYNDMPVSDKNTLNITCHPLKYVAVQNTKTFITGTTEMRVKLIRNYHRAVEKVRAQYARSSSVRAPLGKPIVFLDFDSSMDSGTSMDVAAINNEDEPKLPTYISRSGRVTKKKFFSYEEQEDSSQDSMTVANDNKYNEEWLIKGISMESPTKPPVKKFNSGESNKENYTARSRTLETKRSDSPKSTLGSKFTSFLNEKDPDPDPFDALKGTPKIPYLTQSAQLPRPNQKKSQSINEIMSRSSLFKDIPKSSRASVLLNAAREETEKQKQQEDKIERFKNSLPEESQALNYEPNELIEVESFVEKRRIVPPLPGRRAVNSRKRSAENAGNAPEALNIVTKKPNLNISVSRPTSMNGGVSTKPVTSKKPEPSNVKAAISKKNMNVTACPLCSVSFPSKEIEEHAATCGEDMFPETLQTQRITCSICDCVIMGKEDMEAHVRVCKDRRSLLK